MVKQEKIRTLEMSAAFNKLKSVLPFHPLDSKAQRLSRSELLRRAIKYIQTLQYVLELKEEEEEFLQIQRLDFRRLL
uniref:Putative LOC725127 [Apis mellifera] n=1 Tax=Lepeophtheirus salmonis TaxID=72036 RepID=A0A0K2U041_LEPSM